MNRNEVITTIKNVGGHFGGVMEVVCGEEYAAGYRRAISNMVELFSKAPLDANFEAEREAMLAHIRQLKAKNAELEQEVAEKHDTIQKLLSHVNIAEVLCVDSVKKRDAPKQRRGVAFIFHK